MQILVRRVQDSLKDTSLSHVYKGLAPNQLAWLILRAYTGAAAQPHSRCPNGGPLLVQGAVGAFGELEPPKKVYATTHW